MPTTLLPPIPQLKFLFRAEVRIAAPLLVGAIPLGERRVVPITGGSFQGEKLSGTILPGGADWQLVYPDGSAIVEARYTLRTDDGALIQVHNRGMRHGPPEVLQRIMQGEIVDPALYYFRTTPSFETGASQYAWLNTLVAVCSAVRTLEHVLLDFYQVT